jgi:hypothetical protein
VFYCDYEYDCTSTTAAVSVVQQMRVYVTSPPSTAVPVLSVAGPSPRPTPRTPKNWRWYDVFRTWAHVRVPQLPDVAGTVLRRTQCPVDVKQRKKQKRRKYLQKLSLARHGG